MTHTHVSRFRSTRRARGLGSLAVAVVVALAGCSGDGPAGADGTIDRDLFIATYIDLRAAALESESKLLSDEDRAAVLERRGVTEDDLFAFAELHGRDVDFMTEVWNQVELRLDEMRPGGEQR